MSIILSIAGSDPSAGAGIQQDLKTITALGGYGATVITALTSQNTMGVDAVMSVPAGVVRTQMESVLSDLDVAAIKIGMVPNVEVARVVADELRRYLSGNRVSVVYDPVMVSTSGRELMTTECVEFVRQSLFPLCTLVTPNLPETARLSGIPLEQLDGSDPHNDRREEAGKLLSAEYGVAFLLKGGHAHSAQMTDHLYLPDGTVHLYSAPRIESSNLHGTGCTLSSAIATYLANGRTLSDAVRAAKEVLQRAVIQGRDLHIGHGNGPLWVNN